MSQRHCDSGDPYAGQARADILIGIGAPLTGPNAAMGAQIKRGAEAAVAEINANRGINGERIELTCGDDVSDPKQGISVANKFVADGVKFIVGHYNSGVSIPASEVYAENGILQTTPASTNPEYTERGLWEYISYLRPRRPTGQGCRRLYCRALRGCENCDRQ